MKSLVRVLTFGLLLPACITLDAERAFSGSCVEDVAKYCKDIVPGGGRVTNCLRANEAALSAACKEEQQAMLWRIRRAPEECADDVIQFCASVRPVDRRIIRCLLQNEKVISNDCRKRLNPGDAAEQN